MIVMFTLCRGTTAMAQMSGGQQPPPSKQDPSGRQQPPPDGEDSEENGKDDKERTDEERRKDSLRQTIDYGISTSRYFKEKDVFFNRDTLYRPDTSMHNFHRHKFDMGQQWYQDLGNVGSARKALYPRRPKEVGSRLGINVFDPYFFDIDDVEYMHTQGPYTELSYGQAMGVQQLAKVHFSRNINPGTNIGVQLRRTGGFRQIGTNTTRDLFADTYSIAIHGSFFTPDRRYALMFHYSYLRNSQSETGGIAYDSTDFQGDNFPDNFFEDFETYRLDRPLTREKRNNYHLYHQYRVAGKDSSNAFYLFHQFDRKKTNTYYNDNNPTASSGVTSMRNVDFYDGRMYFDETRTIDSLDYQAFENKLGVKYRQGDVFASFYGKVRDVGLRRNDSIVMYNPILEYYAGGDILWDITEDAFLKGHLEQSLQGYNAIEANLEWKGWGVATDLYVQAPSMYANRNVSNHFLWSNDFDNETSFFVKGYADINTDLIKFKTSAELFTIGKMIYYDQEALPQQASAAISGMRLTADLRLDWRHWHLQSQAVYYQDDTELIRAPTWFLRNQLYFQEKIFNNKLPFQIGVDVTWRSGYYGYAYMPATRQFHLQDRFWLYNYPVVDLFVNLLINSQANVFVKLGHANQGFPEDGYFTTPYYPAPLRTVHLGLTWKLFD